MQEKIRLCHLYPDLLNLYGDRGNILALIRRTSLRGIDMEVETAAADLAAGSDAVILRHPESVKTISKLIKALA